VASRIRIALLAAWSASLISYASFAIAPAFEVGIPSQLAADLLRRGFDGLDRAGLVAGLASASLGAWDARGAASGLRWLRALLPLPAAAGHALSYLWITPQLAALRAGAGGTIGRLAEGDPGIARFAWLHELSRTLYVAAALIALLCCLWDIAAGASASREKKNRVA
jgi:hypothetical protein